MPSSDFGVFTFFLGCLLVIVGGSILGSQIDEMSSLQEWMNYDTLVACVLIVIGALCIRGKPVR